MHALKLAYMTLKKKPACLASEKFVFPLKIWDIIDLCFGQVFRETVRESDTILSIGTGVSFLCGGKIRVSQYFKIFMRKCMKKKSFF